ncbi:MAG: ABC transporter ATP-binding protein [Clostridiaceae bacterium]|jgi:ABC-2 type transport system ATP-binding protein|nr:ABC transporter ATP-binding protein [Clostridiaceae bacterium]
MDSNCLITVRDVSKNYKRRKALNNISFDVKKGEVLGIIGPNGAGKTTMISLLATINKPESGKIHIFGEDILKNPEKVRASLGYVPQETALYPMLTAYENLDFWGGIYGVDNKLKKEKINKVLQLLRLEDRKNDKVRTFSGGMKKRLNIAASLLHDPDILIMDEPTAGVDILSRATITELVLDLKNSGRTIIITSHHIDDLEHLCDKILVLREGSLLYSGSAADILKATGNDNLEQLMLKLEEA